MPHCPVCQRYQRGFIYGYCGACYERAVKTHGELAVIVASYTGRPERYVFKPDDAVYVHFYRVVRESNRLYSIKSNERQWCLELRYTDGFPCPPTLKFVNPYNYADTNPIYWPKLKFFADPIRQVIDMPYLADKSSYRRGQSRGDLERMKALTKEQYARTKKSKKVPYREYLADFMVKKQTLVWGNNQEAHDILCRWLPDLYVSTIADKIVPEWY